MDRCLQVSGFFFLCSLRLVFCFWKGGVMVLPEWFFSLNFSHGHHSRFGWWWWGSVTVTKSTNIHAEYQLWVLNGWRGKLGRWVVGGVVRWKVFPSTQWMKSFLLYVLRWTGRGESVCLLLGRLLTFRFWVMNKIWSPRARGRWRRLFVPITSGNEKITGRLWKNNTSSVLAMDLYSAGRPNSACYD